ncbi:MAG: hypothetical protein ISR65_03680 [Bacteriovoracaceae bacterium]|nr:hypothetical protein [Bacteriovoracaceae bacterium]
MKRFYKNTKGNLLPWIVLVWLLPVSYGWAQTSLLINSLQGNVFAVTEGNAKVVKAYDRLGDFAEIVTEEGAQVSFSDYYDHKFHLAGSGQVKLLNKVLELKSGYLWLQASSNDDVFYVQTANAQIEYNGGEAVVSFDEQSGKTQLLVIEGEFSFSNVTNSDMKIELVAGQFSFVDREYEDGVPRAPTPIGYDSFKKITGLFYNVAPINKKTSIAQYFADQYKAHMEGGRGIASTNKKDKNKKGQGLVYMRKNKIAKSAFNFPGYYNKKVDKMLYVIEKKNRWKRAHKKSGVKINIYGAINKNAKNKSLLNAKQHYHGPGHGHDHDDMDPQRAPASIGSQAVKIDESDPFERSLGREFKLQMRHKLEVNELIRELNNYRQDYQTDY